MDGICGGGWGSYIFISQISDSKSRSTFWGGRRPYASREDDVLGLHKRTRPLDVDRFRSAFELGAKGSRIIVFCGDPADPLEETGGG
jgi:hypothetical protein